MLTLKTNQANRVSRARIEWTLFQHDASVSLDGVRAILQAIEREDGSGKSFNLRCLFVDGPRQGELVWVYVRLN